MEITYDILANSKPLKDNLFQNEMLDFLFRHFTCFDKYFVYKKYFIYSYTSMNVYSSLV